MDRDFVRYYTLRKVKEFVDKNIGKKFVIKRGIFEYEMATVVGYTTRDGFGEPSVIVELPENMTGPISESWGLDCTSPDDHFILDVAEDACFWYVYIEVLEEC